MCNQSAILLHSIRGRFVWRFLWIWECQQMHSNSLDRLVFLLKIFCKENAEYTFCWRLIYDKFCSLSNYMRFCFLPLLYMNERMLITLLGCLQGHNWLLSCGRHIATEWSGAWGPPCWFWEILVSILNAMHTVTPLFSAIIQHYLCKLSC